MLHQLKELYSLLTYEQRARLVRLQVLVLLMSLCELAGVVSIGPFMALVGDMGQLQEKGALSDLYRASGLESPTEFLFWVGVAVLMVLSVATLISMLTIWRLSMYGAKVGAELSSRLFNYYMYQPWLFHTETSGSDLTNKIAQECARVTNSVINPIMQMNARILMVVVLGAGVFILEPVIAITGVIIFLVAYGVLFSVVRGSLVSKGATISEVQQQRFKLMDEGFGGIRDVLLLGRQKVFTNRFDEASNKFADGLGKIQVISQVPRYAMELVAFGSIISLILFLLAEYDGNLGAILPLLSVYALAGLKLLPAFQQIYHSMSQIRGSLVAFENIREDLRASSVHSNSRGKVRKADDQLLVPRETIELRDVQFTYPGKSEPALKDINLTIPVNRTIGFVGASGSGKSTLIDVMLGLISPQKGTLLIDGRPVSGEQYRLWQNALGFVPQSIFLADSSIRENIAFGLSEEAIDSEKVARAGRMAHLDELVDSLPNGANSRVGDRGVQLSGGQRQRIGIARALYHDAEVLMLDEATSALDGITEKLIMNAIHDFSGKKTIIMIAHRLATVKKCDQIYFMRAGRLIDSGSYEELLERNCEFRRMASHS